MDKDRAIEWINPASFSFDIDPTLVWIIIEGGNIFEGTPEQFGDCFFTNVNRVEIEDWARNEGWSVEFPSEIPDWYKPASL